MANSSPSSSNLPENKSQVSSQEELPMPQLIANPHDTPLHEGEVSTSISTSHARTIKMLHAAKTELNSKKCEIDELKRQVENKTNELRRQDCLESQIEEARRQQFLNKRTIDQLKEQNGYWKKLIGDLSDESEEPAAKKKRIQDVEQYINEWSEVNKKLQKDLENKNRKITQMEQIAKKKEHRSGVEWIILHAENDIKDSRIRKLEAELVELKTNKTPAQEPVSQRPAATEDSEASDAILKQRIEELEALLKNKDEQIKAAKAEIQKVNADWQFIAQQDGAIHELNNKIRMRMMNMRGTSNVFEQSE